MKIIITGCPDQRIEELLSTLVDICDSTTIDCIEIATVERESSSLIEFFEEEVPVGYAVVEKLDALSTGELLSDVIDDEDYDKSVEYVDSRMKAHGYYLHVFEIFPQYQNRGLGKKAENLLMKELAAPVLLYALSESIGFWESLSYTSLDGEYYFVKEM